MNMKHTTQIHSHHILNERSENIDNPLVPEAVKILNLLEKNKEHFSMEFILRVLEFKSTCEQGMVKNEIQQQIARIRDEIRAGRLDLSSQFGVTHTVLTPKELPETESPLSMLRKAVTEAMKLAEGGTIYQGKIHEPLELGKEGEIQKIKDSAKLIVFKFWAKRYIKNLEHAGEEKIQEGKLTV